MAIKSEVLVYVGTYTENVPGGSKGIYVAPFDSATGKLGALELVAELKNPSFVAASSDAKFLYAVSEVGVPGAEGGATGFVASYAIGAHGKLAPVSKVESRGTDPCHVAVSHARHTVAVANYSSGSTVSLHTDATGAFGNASIDRHSGHGPNTSRQEGPHAHSVTFSPDDRLLLSCDLGADRVFVYRHDARTGAITPHSHPFVALEPGSGPRHLALHPSGHYAYVICELTSNIAAFKWNASAGTLRQFQHISTLPLSFTAANTTAEIAVHPNGRFVYGSNRGHDSIAAYSVDAASGRLTLLSHTSTGGKSPRSFAIDPSGRWLLAANQLSDDIFSFAIDPHTGALAATGGRSTLSRPVCVSFVPLRA